MKLFKWCFRLGAVGLLAGGWTLAAASLHVVRSPGKPEWLGKFTVVPKDKITFRDTWVDTTHWNWVDRTAHPGVESRLKELDKLGVLEHVKKEELSCCPAPKAEVVEKSPPVEKTASKVDEAPRRNNNIFDDLNDAGKKPEK